MGRADVNQNDASAILQSVKTDRRANADRGVDGANERESVSPLLSLADVCRDVFSILVPVVRF